MSEATDIYSDSKTMESAREKAVDTCFVFLNLASGLDVFVFKDGSALGFGPNGWSVIK